MTLPASNLVRTAPFRWMLGVVLCVVVLLFAVSKLSPLRCSPTATSYETLNSQPGYDPRALYLFDPDVLYMFRPRFEGIRAGSSTYVHRTTSLGLLGDKEIDPSPHTKKILFLGGSVAYGEGVAIEDTMVSVLQDMAGEEYQMVNASCPGWTTHQQFAFFKKYLSDIDWHAVVLVFCLDNTVPFEFTYGTPTTLRPVTEEKHYGVDDRISRQQLAAGLAQLRERFQGEEKLQPLAEHDNRILRTWNSERFGAFMDTYLPPLAQFLKPRKLIVISIPTREQVISLTQGAAPDIVLAPQQQLGSFCGANHIEFFNTVESLQGLAIHAFEDYYYDQTLPTAGFQAIMAGYLWPLLSQLI